MSQKFVESAQIINQKKIASDVFSMWIRTKQVAGQAVPGQFLSLYCRDSSRLLPRPISICEIGANQDSLRIVYRVVGTGTDEFSQMKSGEEIKILGPLGNGFPLGSKKAFLIGGGIGIPPMLELAKQLTCEKEIILGYRDERFMEEDFSLYGRVHIATEDGSFGQKGNVLDVIKAKALHADVIYACGPLPMLRAICAYAKEQKMECWISMEERMACGIGACLACVCNSAKVDEHTHVKNKRVCKEGPVFSAEEVVF